MGALFSAHFHFYNYTVFDAANSLLIVYTQN